MCSIDLDTCDVFTDTPRKARKEHRCDCCRRIVLKGETYFKHFSLYEGHVTDEKCCKDCNDDRDEFAAAPGHMNCNPSSFMTVLHDCVVENSYLDADYVPPHGPMTKHEEQDWRWKDMLAKLEARNPRNAA